MGSSDELYSLKQETPVIRSPFTVRQTATFSKMQWHLNMSSKLPASNQFERTVRNSWSQACRNTAADSQSLKNKT